MGRPTRALLSPGKICRAALELVDELGDFTLPMLARRLGVSPSSIYHHVDGRPQIINGMRSLISADLLEDPDFPPGHCSPREQIERWARLYCQALSRHGNAIPLLLAEPVTDAATLELYERLAVLLRDLGLHPRAVAVTLTVIESFVLGSAMDAASPTPAWITSAAEHPALHAALHSSGLDTRRPAVSFDAGISALVARLDAIVVPGDR